MNVQSDRKASVGEPAGVHEPVASADSPSHEIILAGGSTLPVRLRSQRRLTWGRFAVLLLVFAASGGGPIYWLKYSQPSLPTGIVSGNGRLEADRIDISTKF